MTFKRLDGLFRENIPNFDDHFTGGDQEKVIFDENCSFY
eukprot:CAMPEP_0114992526 /NCGR_PEP_ID=MMETSP0216-20121206/11991_1 /TAXON_ID=223996 /ORGANISM="Protocruzia adherens, Strain Boccale" /LENGTH=38 /DNA_ID= /DNA_START= /DNA_END= /DNA_ORIENTATION=